MLDKWQKKENPLTGLAGMGGGVVSKLLGASGPKSGQQLFSTPGTYSWTAPIGITTVSVVAVGGGGGGTGSGGVAGGGGGGGLGWKNNISVTPGQSYTVVVGAKGTYAANTGVSGGDSYFINTSTVKGGGGSGGSITGGGSGGNYTGDGGGNGGTGSNGDGWGYGGDGGSGGGAGGYSGNGGNGGQNGSGGGGGGGGHNGSGTGQRRAGGGGVGLLGEGTSGVAQNNSGNHPQGYYPLGGTGGSGGTDAGQGFFTNDTTLNSSKTLPANKNVGIFGPYTIGNNVTLTVPTGTTFTVV